MAELTLAEERVSLASNWTLVWWRFRKHRLAMASALALLGFYAVVLCPDFFSTEDPEATDARAKRRQAELLAQFGGREKALARGDLGFTPAPGTPAEINQ